MLSIFVEGTGNGLCSERKPVRACKIIKNSKIRFEISLFVKYYVSFFFPFSLQKENEISWVEGKSFRQVESMERYVQVYSLGEGMKDLLRK